jgi:UDP-glucuronate 4-epimerase
MPYSVSHNVDHPVSLYAATKKANELMAHAYSHLTAHDRIALLHGIRSLGSARHGHNHHRPPIVAGDVVNLFNYGRMRRDFTYLDDIVEAVVRLVPQPAEPDPTWSAETPDPATSNAPYRIYNIGNNAPVDVREVLHLIEKNLGRIAKVELVPIQSGDVAASWADINAADRHRILPRDADRNRHRQLHRLVQGLSSYLKGNVETGREARR